MSLFESQFRILKNQLILDSSENFNNVEIIISSLSDEEWCKKPKGKYTLDGKISTAFVYNTATNSYRIPWVGVDDSDISFFNSQDNFSRFDGPARIFKRGRIYEYIITNKNGNRVIQTRNPEEYWNHPLVLAMKNLNRKIDRKD